MGVFLLIAVYFIFDNSNEIDDPTPSLSVLVKDSIGGGLCMSDSGDGYGCNTLLTINTDGKYKISSNRDNKTVILGAGNITQKELNNLKELIYKTDFEEIKKYPFTDMCPTAYDGSESVYTFYILESVTEIIGSCQYDLSRGYSVFQEISRIRNEYQKKY